VANLNLIPVTVGKPSKQWRGFGFKAYRSVAVQLIEIEVPACPKVVAVQNQRSMRAEGTAGSYIETSCPRTKNCNCFSSLQIKHVPDQPSTHFLPRVCSHSE
jgi:phage FluMu protein Com